MIAGPIPCLIVATWPSGIVVGAPFGPARRAETAAGRRRCGATRGRAAPRRRASRRVGSSQSPASMPANAGRSACATCPTVTPSEPATPRLRSTSSSGFCPFVERPMSTAPGVALTICSTCSARLVERRDVVPLELELQLLASTGEVVGEHRERHAGDVLHLVAQHLAISSALRFRSFFGVRRT